ncbi:RNA polymerase sigma factor [Microterricola viridarii]|uniref:RNA polymerase sigma-70 factor, ECF subfamily n=1 Tax=Microterricola viridarii TaxID=412690 RepID=A0A1H1VIM0_9MICO|nr:RNA polymerase sigma factor [Microterricola viridarii]SDS84718.1 RNA polymerase sigma-70 factor, ECF subfamily [Microterricola viridarii]
MEERDSDAALWLEAVSGTERAFAVIFDRHRARVFRAAYRRVGNVADAEDAVAIVFLEAWRLRKKVRIVDGSLLPWLLTVTTNVTRNLTRAQRRYRRLIGNLPPSPSAEDAAPQIDARIDLHMRGNRLAQALRKLAPADRAVVDLCLVEELPIAAAAAVLGIPAGTVKSRLHRARGQLRTELTDVDTSVADGEITRGGAHREHL